MVGRVARIEAVLALLKVRLPDEIDHVVVVEGVHHVAKEALALARRLPLGQGGDGVKDQFVGPRVVAGEHLRFLGLHTAGGGIRSSGRSMPRTPPGSPRGPFTSR